MYNATARGFVVPVGLAVTWAVAAHTGLVDTRFLVAPERVLLAPFGSGDASYLWSAVGLSLLRMAVGFATGVMLGAAVGAALATSPLANRMAGPSLTGLRQITLFAWIPLLTAWFGNGEMSKFVFITLAAFFPMALNTQQGITKVPTSFLEVARVLRMSRRRVVMFVVIPAALPAIVTGVEIALINAWIGTIAAEYAMGYGRGIGTFLEAGREQFRMDIVILGVLALAIVGYVLNAGMRLTLRRVVFFDRGAR